MNEFILWHVAFFILSAHLYMWDKKPKGPIRKIYIWFHNFTSHKDNKIVESEKGFVYNQKTRTKVKFAIVISLIFSLALLVLPGAMTLPMEILIFFTKIPTIILGLFAGVALEKFYVTMRSVMGFVDKVENQEVNIKEEISEAFDGAIDKVVETTGGFVDKAKDSISTTSKKTSSTQEAQEVLAEKPKIPLPSDEEALDFLKDYTKNKWENNYDW